MTELPVWDLTDLYKSADDEKMSTDIDNVIENAKLFADEYRGKICGLSAAEFAGSIIKYNDICASAGLVSSYSHLLHAADSRPPEHGALLQRVSEKMAELNQYLIFFTLEIVEIADDKFDEMMLDGEISKWRMFLIQTRAEKPHRLTEPEEKILSEKSVTGRRAFVRLFDETIQSATYPLTENGEEKDVQMEILLARLYSPDRELRAGAAEAMTAGLKKNQKLYTYITNTLLHDKAVNDRLVKFDRPESARHQDDCVSTETVDVMINAVTDRFDIVGRYYKLKREILGLDTLYHYDRYAPIALDTKLVEWNDAVEIVKAAYDEFSPDFGIMANKFFDNSWIDVGPRPGKRGGAFCAGITPDHHPYLLLNFQGKKRDVMTLAHEMGHGIHDLLAAQNPYLQYHPSLAAAETASVFGEMMTFRKLLQADGDANSKLSLLTGKIEDIFATVFRQSSMYKFEQELHTARRRDGELTVEAISEIWQRNVQAMFGNSVTMGEGHSYWWMYIPHFIHTPFYVYAYAFGQLMVMALYAEFNKTGDDFIPGYRAMLQAGGTLRPDELMQIAGININRPEFWAEGLAAIEQLVIEAEKAWEDIKFARK
jgi:oligoendopeptidase F